MAELQNILELTASVVSAYLAHNQVTTAALPGLIQDIYSALARADTPPDAAFQEPAVPIRRSVFPHHIVCLEDGEHLMMLKRHLRVHHGMTPHEYRAKWGLPASYPMTAPDYGHQRSELAKAFGLGQRAAAPQAESNEEPKVRKMPARRGRGSKG